MGGSFVSLGRGATPPSAGPCPTWHKLTLKERDLDPDVHCSILCRSQEAEATQASTERRWVKEGGL